MGGLPCVPPRCGREEHRSYVARWFGCQSRASTSACSTRQASGRGRRRSLPDGDGLSSLARPRSRHGQDRCEQRWRSMTALASSAVGSSCTAGRIEIADAAKVKDSAPLRLRDQTGGRPEYWPELSHSRDSSLPSRCPTRRNQAEKDGPVSRAPPGAPPLPGLERRVHATLPGARRALFRYPDLSGTRGRQLLTRGGLPGPPQPVQDDDVEQALRRTTSSTGRSPPARASSPLSTTISYVPLLTTMPGIAFGCSPTIAAK